MRNQLKEKETESASANAEILSMKTTLVSAETANATNGQRIAELQQELGTQKAILKTAQEENQAASEKREISARFQALEKEISQARNQIARLDTELAEANKRVTELKEERQRGGGIFSSDPEFLEYASGVCARIHNEIMESQKPLTLP